MNKAELRTLKVQLALVVGMFLVCAAGAGFMATQRAFFEGYMKEEYAELPADLLPLAEAAARGRLTSEDLTELPEPKRLALYDHWMRQAEPPKRTPAALVAADPALYLARAERTLACGNAEQRRRALKFLELADSDEAVPILHKARRWAQRRKLAELGNQIETTLKRIES
jgi:hypothetical protein